MEEELQRELARLVGPLTLCESLCLLRRRRSLSQHNVAVATNIPATIISMLERGTCQSEQHIETLRRFYAADGNLDPRPLSLEESLFILRRRLDLSQADVEAGAGVPHTVICMVERGTRPVPLKHLRSLVAFYRRMARGGGRVNARSPGTST